MLEKFKAALVLFALVAACGTQDYHSLPKYAVNDILSDYRENEAAAERKYRGQQFAVIGKVKNVDAEGQIAVLQTPLLRLLTEAKARYKNLEDLVKLEKGQEVALVCTGDGYAKQGLEFDSVLSGGEVKLQHKNELRFDECFPLPPPG